jgi:4-carboxymuconolactone decarboxylase
MCEKKLPIIEDQLNYLIENYPDLYKAYENYGKTLHEQTGPLESKCRWLIKIAVSTTCQYEYALCTHIRKALKAGCTKKDIEHAILLTAPSAGFPKAMEALLILREVLEELE